jgi:hypothetical protein
MSDIDIIYEIEVTSINVWHRFYGSRYSLASPPEFVIGHSAGGAFEGE